MYKVCFKLHKCLLCDDCLMILESLNAFTQEMLLMPVGMFKDFP